MAARELPGSSGGLLKTLGGCRQLTVDLKRDSRNTRQPPGHHRIHLKVPRSTFNAFCGLCRASVVSLGPPRGTLVTFQGPLEAMWFSWVLF